ncbi:Transport ATP-binding protein CydD [Roseibacterium elongatum DSM 19469]|uniref:Transport ATP-binding protein CydD n=1 Tax=Roseicyclus elongatus DSM 19469 TaxID=1294273 RepID=W8S1A3_9RHOB|nr:thiol reductant ABC exporter subunit CydD [Roseibacterium elongatum]AHM02491.1 Transport ATP-binding protein CydD [Roseibacterium elongatum DSM 19469]
MRLLKRPTPDPASRRLTQALAPQARRITNAARLTTVAALLWPVMAAAVALAFGALVAGTATLATILSATAVFVAVGVLRMGLSWRAAAMLDHAADAVLATERAALLARQERLSPRAGGRTNSAAVAALLVDKLPHLRPHIMRARPAAMRAAVVPLALLILALPLSWAVALIFLIAGPLIPVFMALVGLAAREASERQMDEIGSLSALLSERLGALLDIRLLDARSQMLSDFEERAEGLRARTMAVLRVAFLSSTVLELFSALGVAMVAVFVGFALLGEIGFGAGATPLTLSQGVFLLMLAPEFFQPLRDLAAAWHDKAAALAVARDLTEIEAGDEAEILGAGAPADALPGAAIRIDGLALGTMRFPDLEIAPGQSVAFTGPSGSGKSTLIALIGGLVAPDAGRIRIGDIELDASSADAWRAQVAWVPQAPHFHPGPLRDTLTLGLPDTDADAIARGLALASASDIVARLPQGLDTPLGESGTGVSGGEARRLMIARAALSGRPVILADEPTADLDRDTASEIITALCSLSAGGATVIVATHDPTLAAAMTRHIALAPDLAESAA